MLSIYFSQDIIQSKKRRQEKENPQMKRSEIAKVPKKQRHSDHGEQITNCIHNYKEDIRRMGRTNHLNEHWGENTIIVGEIPYEHQRRPNGAGETNFWSDQLNEISHEQNMLVMIGVVSGRFNPKKFNILN